MCGNVIGVQVKYRRNVYFGECSVQSSQLISALVSWDETSFRDFKWDGNDFAIYLEGISTTDVGWIWTGAETLIWDTKMFY